MQVWMRVSACRRLDSGNSRSFSVNVCEKRAEYNENLFFANEARMHVYIKILARVTAVAFLWHISNDADVSRNSLMSTWLERRKRCLGNDVESRFAPPCYHRGEGCDGVIITGLFALVVICWQRRMEFRFDYYEDLVWKGNSWYYTKAILFGLCKRLLN